MNRAMALAVVGVAIAASLVIALRRGRDDEGARCGPGFTPDGARCWVGPGCPAPLVQTPAGCDAPDVRVAIPGGALAIGPSDWEAEGRVPARSIRVQAFRIDAFEVTRGAMGARSDLARAANNVSPTEAMALCASRGGRLPTEDEWIVAATSAMNPPRRYPWGDTGAVCRRAAWGLDAGPCAHGADGPDTVGAHPDGDSALGVHDLAGNVAEWVRVAVTAPAAPTAVAKGGSWATALAADLRIWARLELPLPLEAEGVQGGGGPRDPRVGFRCVYAP
jgi:formylglycine-generating enzyme required for sulfatase activity